MLEALQAVDGGILLWIQTFLRGVLDPVVAFYTQLGDAGFMWIVLTVVLLLWKKTRRAGVASAIALVCSLICTNLILKHLFTRPRPWLEVAGLVPIVNETDPNSFPSGHTSAAFAAVCAWWPNLPWKWAKITAVGLAALMALSRLYVGVHYPSDVLAGVLVGLFCGWIANVLLNRIRPREEQPR